MKYKPIKAVFITLSNLPRGILFGVSSSSRALLLLTVKYLPNHILRNALRAPPLNPTPDWLPIIKKHLSNSMQSKLLSLGRKKDLKFRDTEQGT